MPTCEICNAKIGGLTGVTRASAVDIAAAKSCGLSVTDEICRTCLSKMRIDSKLDLPGLLAENENKLSYLLAGIRITTYPPEPNLQHEYCGLVTAFSPIGTGPISQLLSGFTDLFGKESGTYAEKFRQGELSCTRKIQQQALLCDANAIAGTQLTYTELTSGHGLILVCMAGTAIRLADGPQDIQSQYNDLMEEREKLIAQYKST